MKKSTLFLVILLAAVFFATCKKDSHTANTTLTGKWKLTESLADPGDGSGKWRPVPTSAVVYIQFESNGKLEGTAFPEYVSYAIKDSVTLTFTSKDNTLQNYRYAIKNDTISMSPDGPIRCFEACGARYVKVK
ncbi:MAG: hypothetical protein V4577_13225 [Bacteroidota bacterium]